jgi:hypothetical protein
MTTNPIAKHTSNLFASRGLDFDAAIAYAKEVIEAMPNETRASAYTALMVVVNTAANVCTLRQRAQSQGPSPEKLALIDLIDQRIDEHKLIREDDLEDKISQWMDDNVDIEDKISDWMSDNFDVTDYNVDDAISAWMSNNMTDEIESVIKNSLTFSVIVN